MRVARILLATVMLAALAGCVPSPPDPPQSPTPAAPTPTRTPTSTPNEVILTALTIRSDRVVAIREDGSVLDEASYLAPAQEIRETLTDWFEFEPVVTITERTPSDRFFGTTYDWEGFSLNWYGFEAEPETAAAAFYVVSTAASVRDVRVTTVEQIAVGADIAPIEAAHPELANRQLSADGTEYAWVFVDPIPTANPSASPDAVIAVSVSAWSGVSITSITAPVSNYGL